MFLLRIAASAQALAIFYGWQTAGLIVPGLRNPSLAGTFVALLLFEWPWIVLGIPAVIVVNRHLPYAVLFTVVVVYGWRYGVQRAA